MTPERGTAWSALHDEDNVNPPLFTSGFLGGNIHVGGLDCRLKGPENDGYRCEPISPPSHWNDRLWSRPARFDGCQPRRPATRPDQSENGTM